jgi:ferredoxin
MRLHIDLDRCTGHGRCYSLAPSLFEPDEEDGHGVVLHDGIVPEGEEAAARLAVNNCPERAISLQD